MSRTVHQASRRAGVPRCGDKTPAARVATDARLVNCDRCIRLIAKSGTHYRRGLDEGKRTST